MAPPLLYTPMCPSSITWKAPVMYPAKVRTTEWQHNYTLPGRSAWLIPQLQHNNLPLIRFISKVRMEEYAEILRENSQLKRAIALGQMKQQQVVGQKAQAEAEVEFLKTINGKYKKEIEELRERASSLQSEKKQLQTSYQQSIQEVKKEIEEKQVEFDNIENRLGPNFDHAIARMKITHELQAEYSSKLDQKQEELLEARNTLSDTTREVELLHQKLRLKEKHFNNLLEEINEAHLKEIENITKTILQTNRTDESAVKEDVRKMKREVSELRERLVFKDQELDELHAERLSLRDRMNEITINLNESAEKSREESKIYKSEYQNLTRMVSQNEARKELQRVTKSQKDREIARLNSVIQDLQEDVAARDKRITKLEEEISRGEIEMVKIKGQFAREEDRVNYEMMANTIHVLEKDQDTLRVRCEELKRQNTGLQEHNNKQRKEIESHNAQKEREDRKASLSPEKEQKPLEVALAMQSKAYEKIIRSLKKEIGILSSEKQKLDEKFKKNKDLLKEANLKILNLIQNKIQSYKPESPERDTTAKPSQLQSPAHRLRRTFEFTSQGRTNPQNIPQSHHLEDQFYSKNPPSVSHSRSPSRPYLLHPNPNSYPHPPPSTSNKSSSHFYEIAQRLEARKAPSPCGHKHH